MLVGSQTGERTLVTSPLLAEGFRNVDSQTRDEQSRCVQCLSFIKNNPGFLKVRDTAFERLALNGDSLTIYDVGCGAGFDTLELAKRLSAGRVVGVDISSALIEEAKNRSASQNLSVPVEFRTGDARTLTSDAKLSPDSADRVYMERALQHIPRHDVEKVVGQFYSVLKSGGLFVSVEPNWELFTVRSNDRAFFRKLHHHWVDRFNHGDVAMNIPVAMREAGFVGVSSDVVAVEFNRFEDGELVYDFTRTAGELVAKGMATAEEAGAWIAQQKQAGDTFYCCLMMSVTSGQKPY
jgi:ubiquinone/menaquinone biosynthesis C-methylase UbiE